MREVRTGVWHWTAPHPDWKPGENWDRMVSSYAIDDGERLLLFDPLAAPGELEALASERETAIVLTCPWHARDAESLARRLEAQLYVPPPDDGDPDPVGGQVFRAGDRLPVGVEAFPGMEPNDLVLWVESSHALLGDARRTWWPPRAPGRLGERGRVARADPRVASSIARAARRARPPGTRLAQRSSRPRARARLSP